MALRRPARVGSCLPGPDSRPGTPGRTHYPRRQVSVGLEVIFGLGMAVGIAATKAAQKAKQKIKRRFNEEVESILKDKDS